MMIQQYANGVMFQILASIEPSKIVDHFEENLDSFLHSILQKTFERESNT